MSPGSSRLDRYSFWSPDQKYCNFVDAQPPTRGALHQTDRGSYLQPKGKWIFGKPSQAVFFTEFEWQDARGVTNRLRRKDLVETLLSLLDRTKIAADLYGDLQHVAMYALTWCDYPVIEAQLIEDVRRAFVQLGDLFAEREVIAETFAWELERIHLAEQNFAHPKEWRAIRQPISFESFRVVPDPVRRSQYPKFPFVKLVGDAVAWRQSRREQRMSIWPFEVCRFLGQHDWSERGQHQLDQQRLDNARAIFNYLVMSTPSLAPVLKYDFDSIDYQRVITMCTVAREYFMDAEQDQATLGEKEEA